MTKRIIVIALCFLGISCGNKLLEEPENLIPRDQMADILYDMALLDAIENSHPKVLEANDLRVMEFLYEKYGIDSLQFVQSDRYYASLPGEYLRIYESVEERLTRNRDSISEVIQQGKQVEADTIAPDEDYD
jgi:hypothetical protein